MTDLYIGIMSGTSLDGIDAGLFSFADHQCITHATHSAPFDVNTASLLKSFARGGELSAADIGCLDSALGAAYAAAATSLLSKTNANVVAIGCHGQTVWHQPSGPHAFTWQLGDPHRLVETTGVTTVADFRRADVAAGGQGAPLAPLFHRWLWPKKNAAVVNIGGISNITPLRGASGFDCGPGNTLMDAWARQHLGKAYDESGDWALSGQVIPRLLATMQNDEYFLAKAPKSTGPEHFNLLWLDTALAGSTHLPADVQATLLELTAWCIAEAVNQSGAQGAVICGGGTYNLALMARLTALCKVTVEGSGQHGLDPQWVEAACFAWLAKQAVNGEKVDTRVITGARHPVRLGVIFPA
ncbi:MAG: anhydro-N-acetylmuramic acid kinase [Gammaproteobacteria bacterium]|jgi:anhydro-N-acetylmuramic acid kinase